MWGGMGEPAYDYYAMCWPSILYDLTRPPTLREAYYLKRHNERYERRYGKKDVAVRGDIGVYNSLNIHIDSE